MTLKTSYHDIVDTKFIGKRENPFLLNDLLKKANTEKLAPAVDNPEKILVVGIDLQQDFMEDGALGVPGAHQDVENFTRFIYNHMDKISQIALSLDTHNPFQVFHPCWFVDGNGNNPPSFTAITLNDLDEGKWIPVVHPKETREYVVNLAKNGKKVLVIWPYHCLQGTQGCALENQFANMVYFYSIVKKSVIVNIVKGFDPLTEMYGIVKAEYDQKNYVNIAFLNKFETFDKIFIGGEAKSHCVGETIAQILDHYAQRPEITKKIYILEDCMSTIPGFEKTTEDTFNDFKRQHGVNIVKSTDVVL